MVAGATVGMLAHVESQSEERWNVETEWVMVE